MSKKNKKHTQQNLPLKERLARRWEKRDWSAFIELFVRDMEASLRSPLASYWHDALYNCLTAALFVDKDFKALEMTVALIQAESKRGVEVPPFLSDCTQVAADFLNVNDKQATLPFSLSPLRAEEALPSPYASLRRGMASIGATPPKVQKGTLFTSAKKLAKQYAALGEGKGLTPYTQCLKTAQALEEAAAGLHCAPTLRAVRIIVALIRELYGPKDSRERLRDPLDLPWHALFREMPCSMGHPLILGLWDSFCRQGGEKYGGDWEKIARIMILPHINGCDLLKKTCQILKDKPPLKGRSFLGFWDDEFLAKEKIKALICCNFPWTEQELYILKTFSIGLSRKTLTLSKDFDECFEFLQYFKDIGIIGKKWRENAPWYPLVLNVLERLLLQSSGRSARDIFKSDIPLKELSNRTLLFFLLSGGCTLQDLHKIVGEKRPWVLSEKDLHALANALAETFPPLSMLRNMRTLLTGFAHATLMVFWMRGLWGKMKNEEEEPLFLDDDEVLVPRWDSVSSEYLEFMAEALPPDSPEGCFCQLCLGMEPYSLSSDAQKIDAFFEALPPAPDYAGDLLLMLIGWGEVPADFLLRLFEKTLPWHVKEASRDSAHWLMLAYILEDLPYKLKTQLAKGFVAILSRLRLPNSNALLEAIDELNALARAKESIRPPKKGTLFKRILNDLEQILK